MFNESDWNEFEDSCCEVTWVEFISVGFNDVELPEFGVGGKNSVMSSHSSLAESVTPRFF